MAGSGHDTNTAIPRSQLIERQNRRDARESVERPPVKSITLHAGEWESSIKAIQAADPRPDKLKEIRIQGILDRGATQTRRGDQLQVGHIVKFGGKLYTVKAFSPRTRHLPEQIHLEDRTNRKRSVIFTRALFAEYEIVL